MILAIFMLLAFIRTAFSCEAWEYGTQGQEDEIVRLHNQYRQCIANGPDSSECQDLGVSPSQPQAANMYEMVWSDELAQVAQNWAYNCEFKHNPDRSVGSDQYVGENIYIGYLYDNSDTGPDWPAAFKSWFGEEKDYTYGKEGEVQQAGTTGHYTQLVWAESYEVGCGYIDYTSTEGSYPYSKLYVCNYRPGGNIQGEAPYVEGPPDCSGNGGTDSSNYAGLCAPP